jgi:hypothetical protein
MRRQVKHVSVHQTSKVIATAYALVIAIIAILAAIYTIVTTGDVVTALMSLVLTPIFYWVIFYIVNALGLWFYNLVAHRLGGIEFDLVDTNQTEPNVRPPEHVDHSSTF